MLTTLNETQLASDANESEIMAQQNKLLEESNFEKGQAASYKMGNIDFHQSLRSKDNYDPVVALGFDPSKAHLIPHSEAYQRYQSDDEHFKAGGYYIPNLEQVVEDTPVGANALKTLRGYQSEAGMNPTVPEDAKEAVVTVGSYIGKSAVWNHEFRHRGLRILRDNYTDEEIVDRMPMSWRDKATQFWLFKSTSAGSNKKNFAKYLLDKMGESDGNEWLMATYDKGTQDKFRERRELWKTDSLGRKISGTAEIYEVESDIGEKSTTQTNVGNFLDEREVGDLMSALNSLSKELMDKIQREKFEEIKRSRGLK